VFVLDLAATTESSRLAMILLVFEGAAARPAQFESNPLNQELMKVPEASVNKLNPPRLQERRALLMAGLQEHYTRETQTTIPEQWKRLPFGKIPGQLGHMAYGVVLNLDEKTGEFDYFCGVEIATVSPAHGNLKTYKSPHQKYAIFCHRENVSRLRDTIHAIFTAWLPTSGQSLSHPTATSPNLIEYYGDNFDPESGTGDIEVWIPIKA
jgi:AraC family transcriptional regulator